MLPLWNVISLLIPSCLEGAYTGDFRFLENFSVAVCESRHILYCVQIFGPLLNNETHALPVSKPYTITLLPLSIKSVARGIASLISSVHKSISRPELISYILIWPKWLVTIRRWWTESKQKLSTLSPGENTGVHDISVNAAPCSCQLILYQQTSHLRIFWDDDRPETGLCLCQSTSSLMVLREI
jgi:hypothetical protein